MFFFLLTDLFEDKLTLIVLSRGILISSQIPIVLCYVWKYNIECVCMSGAITKLLLYMASVQ